MFVYCVPLGPSTVCAQSNRNSFAIKWLGVCNTSDLNIKGSGECNTSDLNIAQKYIHGCVVSEEIL